MGTDKKPWHSEETVYACETSGARFGLVDFVDQAMPGGRSSAIRSRTPEALSPPLVGKQKFVVSEKQFAGGFRKEWSLSQKPTALKRAANDFPLAEALALARRKF
jgi:hypothetical protein